MPSSAESQSGRGSGVGARLQAGGVAAWRMASGPSARLSKKARQLGSTEAGSWPYLA